MGASVTAFNAKKGIINIAFFQEDIVQNMKKTG
jgi:hypothetical protein